MEKYLNEIIETTRKLIAFNSIQEASLPSMPFGKANYDCLQTALKICKEIGFTVKNLDGYCGYAEIGEGDSFGILAHLDIVPAGEGWDYDAFKGEIIDGVLYGRGVLDDKGPIVCCIYAIKKLLDEGFLPKKKIRIIFGCNEESGWKCIDHYLQVEKMPPVGFSPDADFPVIYLEKGIAHYTISTPLDVVDITGGLRVNMVPNKASLTVKYTKQYEEFLQQNNATYTVDNELITVFTEGVSAHGSTPEKGVNAIIKLYKLSNIAKLQDFATKFESNNGSGVDLNISDAESGNLTLNLGAISYINNTLFMQLDIRYPVKYTEEFVREKLENNLPNCTILLNSNQLPLYVDKNSTLVQTLLNAYNSVTNENLQPIAIGGGTYARAIEQGVAFGPIFPDMESTIHQANERVKVSDLLRISKIYYKAIKELCF